MKKFVFYVGLLVLSLLITSGKLLAEGVKEGTSARTVFQWQQEESVNLVQEGKFSRYQLGYTQENDIFICDNETDHQAQRGVSQGIFLNQKTPAPIVASLSSKAENVSGGKDGNYSLYIDLVYQDGTALWGQTAPFSPGTHDWETRSLTILPIKAVKSLSMYGLFRSRSGKAFFKDFRLSALQSTGAASFDGVASSPVKGDFPKESFQLRNVAKNSDFIYLGSPQSQAINEKEGKKSAFDVQVRWKPTNQEGNLFYDVDLESQTDEDRILTFYYTVAAPSGSVLWHEHPRRTLKTDSTEEYLNAGMSAVGANGRLSYYPFGAVSGDKEGIAIGLDPNYPVYFRVGYHAESRQLYLACDIALTKEKKTATLRFLQFSFAPQDEFRGALAEYYRIFPEAFRSRTPKQGNWMAFQKISSVKGYEDFHFQFKEGNDEVAWDDAHGITTFRYTEPMTWWMSIPKDNPKTLDVALEQAKKMAKEGNKAAQNLLTSGHYDEEGRLCAQILDTPWCNGAVWSLCDLPGLIPLAKEGKLTYSQEYPIASYETKWSAEIMAKLYPPQADNKGLDGEYIDSSEGYVTAILNFRRDHFAGADRPLAFDRDSLKPGIFRGLIVFEYAKQMSDDTHSIGRLMMANSTPHNIFWLTPLMDVVGTETDWNHGGKWHPTSDDELLYRRAICGPKPYCFLMNTKFNQFTYEHSEKYMKRSLAYGMFPSYFSEDASSGHYFSRPELYDRDRPLFKKYLPLCRRVAEAGWQPMTGATSSDSKVYVERFGAEPNNIALTLFNDSEQAKTVEMVIKSELLQCWGNPTKLKELVSNKTVELKNGKFNWTLVPEDVAVFEKE